MKNNQARLSRTGWTLAALLLAFSAAAGASPENKWRLEFSGNAESDGEIVILFTPVEGEPIETSTPIEKGRSENGVAKDVVKSLKMQLPEKAFHVERDDGEDVLVKKRRGGTKFDVKIVSNTVKHVRIKPEKE